MTHWKAILATIVIFATGFFAGGSFFRHTYEKQLQLLQTSQSPGHTNSSPSKSMFGRLDFYRKINSQLNLSAEQHSKIELILDSSHKRTKLLWEEINPRLREELARVRQEIKEQLTPDQKALFEELLKRSKRTDERKNRKDGVPAWTAGERKE